VDLPIERILNKAQEFLNQARLAHSISITEGAGRPAVHRPCNMEGEITQ
jgi:hypothetical protein